ncbi:MAG: WG repeat-containing protein [Bacteroidaceae bacterium]|nr:WG repeat-containing protein [Bacteroidaceae bacterium]
MKKSIFKFCAATIAILCLVSCGKSGSEEEYVGMKMNKQLAEKLLEYQSNPAFEKVWTKPTIRELGEILALPYVYADNLNLEATALMNEDGEIVTILDSVYYERVDTFCSGVSRVVNENKRCGVVNTKGEMVVPYGKYKIITSYRDGYALALKSNSDKLIILNNKGKEEITLNFEDCIETKCGLILPANHHGDGMMMALYTRSGEELLQEGVVYNYVDGKDALMVQLNDKSWLVYDSKGTCSPLDVDEVREYETMWKGLAQVKKNGKKGFIDSRGEMVIPCEYDDASYVAWEQGTTGFDGLILKKNGKKGIYDVSGKQVWPIEYDEIYTCSKELISCKKDGQAGVMNRKGKWLVFGDIIPIYDNLVPAIGEEGIGIQTGEGEIILPCQYSKDILHYGMSYYEELNILQLGIGGEYLYLNTKTGKEIYRGAELVFHKSGIATVEYYDNSHYRMGLIDCTGKYIVPVEEDQMVMIKGKYVLVSKDGQYIHILDAKGNKIMKIQDYDWEGYPCAIFLDGYYFNLGDGKTHFVNGKGRTFSIDGVLKVKDKGKKDPYDEWLDNKY